MADINLRFTRPTPDPGALALRFGDDGTQTQAAEVVLHGRITGLRGHVSAAALVRVEAHGRITGLRGHVGAGWDSNVDRPERARSSVCYQDAASAAVAGVAAWQRSTVATVGAVAAWQQAVPAAALRASVWQDTLHQVRSHGQLWQEAAPSARALAVRYQQARGLVAGGEHRFQDAQVMGMGVSGGYQQALAFAVPAGALYQRALRVGVRHAGRFGLIGLARWAAVGGRYQDARRPPAGRSVVPVLPTGPGCYDPRAPLHLRFVAVTDVLHLRFACHPDGEDMEPEPPAMVTVPVLRSYIVINSLQLVRADNGQPIAADAFAMSLDDSSWAWSWSAALPLGEESKIQPDANGEPVQVVATVNGTDYRLIVERYSREREFARGRIRVQGRGRNALLDAPYAGVRDHYSATAATAHQLAQSALLINGVSSGWALDWQLTDWYVPGDTWAVKGTPMAAVLDIAAAVNALVLPHRTEQVLRVLPRYRAAPWDWASQVTPDFELPAAAVQVEGYEPVIRDFYDRIYVSGATPGGITAQVTRAGRPGDVLLPMVTHSLITHIDAARQRAIAELAMAGRVASVRLRMQVLSATGVIEPGSMVRYVDGATTHLGAVRGVSVDWTRPVLRQSITLETHP